MSSKPKDDLPIEAVTHIQRRIVLMPRGQKNTTVRETRISLPRLRCLEAAPVEKGRN